MTNYCLKIRYGILFYLIPVLSLQAQNDNSKIQTKTLSIGGRELDGYAINFDFTKKEIFKAWWKFSKEFSRNETTGNDIEHTIPPKEGESALPIIFYSRLIAPDSLTAQIIAAVNDNGMSSDDLARYSEQIRQLLLDFRIDYYKNNLQRKIATTEKQAGRVGKLLDRYTTENIRLDQKLITTKEEKLAHQQAIIANDSLIVELNQKLKINRMEKDSVNQELEMIKEKLDALREMIKGIL